MLIVSTLAFLFGVTSKIADLFNEHGLSATKEIKILCGIVWGALGASLALYDPALAVVYAASVLYWFLRLKLEHANHAIAGVLILLAAFWVANRQYLIFLHLLLLFSWLTTSGYTNSYLAKHYSSNRRLMWFLRLRLRYYIGPIIYSIFIQDPNPAIAIVFGMSGTEIITGIHHWLTTNRKQKMEDAVD